MNKLSIYRPAYYLYIHICPNNKCYIGITQFLPERRYGSKGKNYKSSPRFYSAIHKYGWDNIQHITLFRYLPKDLACSLEKFYIGKFKLQDKLYGYNVSDGGEGTNGYHHSEEYKEKLRNRPIPKSQRRQISETVKLRWKEGRYSNVDYSERVAWNKGLKSTDSIHFGHIKGEFHHSDKSRKKMREAKLGKPAHNRKRVLCVESGEIYDSVSQAQTITGINNISLPARFENRTAGGYHWRYIYDNL